MKGQLQFSDKSHRPGVAGPGSPGTSASRCRYKNLHEYLPAGLINFFQGFSWLTDLLVRTHNWSGPSFGDFIMIGAQTEFSLRVAVCAWCKPHERGSGLGAISHGICLRHLRHLKLQMQGFLPERSGRATRRVRPQDKQETWLPF